MVSPHGLFILTSAKAFLYQQSHLAQLQTFYGVNHMMNSEISAKRNDLETNSGENVSV